MSTLSAKSVAKQPLKNLTAAIGSCSAAGKAYGDCILKDYQMVSKDICRSEFLAFKACVQKRVGKNGRSAQTHSARGITRI